MKNLRRTTFAVPLAIAVCLSLLVTAGWAQRSTGTIRGTVTDPTGAVLPNAKVTLTNTETNVRSTLVTDNSGNYAFPSLIPGTYRVSAEHSGFRIAAVSGVVLAMEESRRVDLTLQVGQATDTVVDVKASALRIDTESANNVSTLTAQQVSNLPVVSRNFMELVTLAAGVSPSFGSSTDYIQSWTNPAPNGDSSVTGVNVSGARVSGTTFTIEGVSSTNTAYGLSAIAPSVDAVQELKVETSYYSAESKGAALVNLSMKSGTNSVHGTAFDFWRDSRLQPTDPRTSHPVTGLPYKTPYHYHSYGGTIGGPIRIPGLYNGKDKSFFFFSYEGLYYRITSLPRVNWIADAWRTGDFSGTDANGNPWATIYDPATTHLTNPALPYDPTTNPYIRDPFPGNKITADRIAPQSRYYVDNFIPMGLGSGRILIPTTNATDVGNWMIRIDHNFSERDKISGRFSEQLTDDVENGAMPLVGRTLDAPGKNLALVQTHMFGPRLVNEFRGGYTRSIMVYTIKTAYGSHDYSKEAGFTNTSADPADFGIPKLAFRGLSAMGNSGSSEENTINTYQLYDVLNWSRGRQNWKFGADFRRDRNKVHTNGSTAQPYFQFYNGYTASAPYLSSSQIKAENSFADFLLGYPSSAQISSVPTINHPHTWAMALFFQNDWAVKPNLTLNLGLRYEYAQWARDNELGGFALDLNFPGGRVLSPNQAWIDTFADPKPVYIAYGSQAGIMNPDRTNFAPRFGFAWRPFHSENTVIRGGFGMFYVQGAEWYEWQRVAHPNLKISPVIPSGNRVTPTIDMRNLFPPPNDLSQAAPQYWTASAFLPSSRHPYAEQWSLGVQRMLAKNLILDARYQGSVGRKLPIYHLFNQASLPDPINYTPVQDRVPYNNFWAQSSVYCFCSSSNYNALQAELERRFERGLSFKLAYTWSKNLDYGSEIQAAGATSNIPQNSRDLMGEYGISSFDVPHRVVLSYTYDLPFGHARRLFSSVPAVVNHIIGGWQTSGIVTYQSGRPWTPMEGWDNSDTLNGRYGDSQRAQQIGNPYPAGFKQTPTQWIDASAFTDPPFGTFGNVPRNSFRGMSTKKWDLSLMKDFRLREGLTLQFRGNIFNATKHFGNNQYPYPYILFPEDFGKIVWDPADTWTASEKQLALKLIF